MGKDHLLNAGQALVQEILEHRLLVGIVVLYCVFALVLGYRFERDVDLFLYSKYFLGMIALVGLAFVYRRFARLMGQPDRRPILKKLYADVKKDVTPKQVVGGGFLFFVFSTYFSAFQSVKAMIPAVKPFTYDVAFAEIDRVIHFGFYPHELLQPLLGYPIATFFIQFFYNIWFLLMLGILAWQMFDRRVPHLRMRFLVSFALVWFVVGSLGAIHLSSAGPVYFDRVTGLEGPYSDHMAWLWSVYDIAPLFTLDMQDLLWEHYSAADLASGTGISAMPSVHVSIATLLFLLSRHSGKWATVMFGVFLAGIMVGSVHLAWHYAIDGYLGAALVLVIWWLVGRFYAEVPSENAAKTLVSGPVQV